MSEEVVVPQAIETVDVTVKVAKEAYELGLALALLVKAGREALKDGISAADLPAVLGVIMSKEFMDGIAGVDKLGQEWGADKEAFVAAFVVAGTKIAKDLQA